MTTPAQNRSFSTRREFLGVTGASLLTVGSALETLGAPAAKRPKKNVKIRLAVVGGGFGAGHHWHEHPNCEVTAVTDLVEGRRQKLVKAYQCENVFPSMEVMLERAAGAFDAVAIFSGAPSHAKHVIACMKAGKHVVSACPAATTLEDCHKLKEIKEKTGLKYMMHESSYYRQPCIAARELYGAGHFGRIVFSEVEYYHPSIASRSCPLSGPAGKRTWRFGYPPMLYPTHALGLMVGVTRERIVKVSCVGQLVGDGFPAGKENAYNNPFNNEIALGTTDQGNICRFAGGWQIAAHGERGQWLGEKMSCYMADYAGRPQAKQELAEKKWQTWEVPKYWETDRLPEPMRHPSGHGGSSAFLCAEFVEALVEDREPTVDIYESIAMTAPGLVAHQSALKGGEQLKVPSFDKA